MTSLCRPATIVFHGPGFAHPLYVTTPIYYVNDRPHILQMLPRAFTARRPPVLTRRCCTLVSNRALKRRRPRKVTRAARLFLSVALENYSPKVAKAREISLEPAPTCPCAVT